MASSICLCRSSDNSCKDFCPQEYVPSTNPEDFLENASLSFLIELQPSLAQSSDRTYILKFSDPPIILKSPYTYEDIDSFLKIEIVGYEETKDYIKTLTHSKKGFFDIKISILVSIQTTNLKAKFLDSSLIVGHNGKKLQNSETSVSFSGESKMMSSILSQDTIKTAAKVTLVAGAATVAASTSAMTLFTIFGIVLGAIAKFFQIIEFTGLLAFFNINFDLVIETILTLIENIGDFDVFDFPFENSMKENVGNSVASKWRGKFSKMEKATWHLMDIGWSGVYMGVIFLIHGIFVIFGFKNKWRDRLSILKANLMQAYIMDQLPVTITTLSNSSIYPLDSLDRKISFITSIGFVSLASYEFLRQYFEMKRLQMIKEEDQTPLDKGLSDLYFDGLCNDEISSSWYVRNYNLLFTFRLVLVAFFIVTMQYLQILQVFLSFVAMLFFLILNAVNFRRHTIFEHRLTKFVRIIQDISFTLMMALICVLYFEQKKAVMNSTLKLIIVGSFLILVIINILLELVIMVKELGSSCCKKKNPKTKNNQVQPLVQGIKVDQTDNLPLKTPTNQIDVLDHDLELPKSKRIIPGIKMKRENVPPEVRKQNIKNLRDGLKNAVQKRWEIKAGQKLSSHSKIPNPPFTQAENEKEQEPESRLELQNWFSPAETPISLTVNKPGGRRLQNAHISKSKFLVKKY